MNQVDLFEPVKHPIFIIFDTETSSLEPGNICQLTYFIIQNKIVTPKNFFFEVDKVDPGAEAVHGLSVEKLKELSNGKRFKDFMNEIKKDFNSADVLIAHNIKFDKNYIETEFLKNNDPIVFNKIFCTMNFFRGIGGLLTKNNKPKNPKLAELCEKLGITPQMVSEKCTEIFKASTGFHDARYDVTATYMCLQEAFKKKLLTAKEMNVA